MRIFFVLVSFFILSLQAPAFSRQNDNPDISSLDPRNRDYIKDFCAYHQASPICIYKPNPQVPPHYTPPASGGGNLPGAGGPFETPPAPTAGCDSTETPNVTSVAAAIASAKSGKIAVLAPGNYSGMNITGGSYNNGTIKCSKAGQCYFGATNVEGVSNLTIDGVTIRGNAVGITVESSKNITIRCSNFIEQTSSGVLANEGGSGTDQLKIYQNNFINSKTGCNYNNKSDCSGHLADGSPVANMDYGVRLYDAGMVDIQKNTFGTLFNHSISMKSRVAYTYIAGNTFNVCGRTCIEPGQEPNGTAKPNRTSGQVVITGNIFNNVKSTILLIKNIHRVSFSGNILNNFSGVLSRLYYFQTGQTFGSSGAIIAQGVPADRSVSVSR